MKPSSTTVAIAPSAPTESFAEGNNEFALALYGRLRRGAGNLICSPYSVRTALGMALAGARGETAVQMRSALRITAAGEAAHAEDAGVMQWLNGAGSRPYEMGVANALWAQDDGHLEEAFVDLITRYYDEGLHLIDFRGGLEAARATMNRWVEHTSRGRFRDFLSAASLPPDAGLALVNLVAFKGTWEQKFSRRSTEDQPFHCEGGAKAPVPLMYRRAIVRYLQADGFQAVDLAYQGDDISMLILLPDRIDGLGTLEATLSAQFLRDCTRGLHKCEVEFFIPRITIVGNDIDMGSELAALGMAKAFEHGVADFSGINGRPPGDSESLRLSAVLQKAFVEVDEEGTVAAAITRAIFTKEFQAQLIPPPVPVFRADHPFIFAIRARESGAILFLGRMTAPA